MVCINNELLQLDECNVWIMNDLCACKVFMCEIYAKVRKIKGDYEQKADNS